MVDTLLCFGVFARSENLLTTGFWHFYIRKITPFLIHFTKKRRNSFSILFGPSPGQAFISSLMKKRTKEIKPLKWLCCEGQLPPPTVQRHSTRFFFIWCWITGLIFLLHLKYLDFQYQSTPEYSYEPCTFLVLMHLRLKITSLLIYIQIFLICVFQKVIYI